MQSVWVQESSLFLITVCNEERFCLLWDQLIIVVYRETNFQNKNQRYLKCLNIWDCARGESSSVELWETWSKLWQQLKPFSSQDFVKNYFEREKIIKKKFKKETKWNSDSNWDPYPPSSPSKITKTKKLIFQIV